MKKYITILFFTFLPFYYSCISGNDLPQAGGTSVGSGISGINNGTTYKAVLQDTIYNDTLALNAIAKLNILKLKFPITASTIVQLLGKNGAYYVRNTTGDIVKTYKLDATYTNTVKVQINTTNRNISGTFNLRFVIDPSVPSNDTTGVNTITFTNGYYIVPTN